MEDEQMRRLKNFEEGLDSDSDDDSSSDDERDDHKQSKDEADSKAPAFEGEDADTDSSSDDDDSDEMEVDMEEVERKLAEVNQQLIESPYKYELLVEKIQLLRAAGELDALRSTREEMHKLYPLSENLWLEWLKDEIKLAETKEEKDKVTELFERAVKDYLSIDIWLEYTKFALSSMEDDNGIEKCREIYERALMAGGLHVSRGSLLWDAYRDFEACLLGLVASNEEQRIQQEKRYTNLCKRRISVPLFGMEEAYEEISSSIELDDASKHAYENALKKLKSIEKYEQQIVVTVDDEVSSKPAEYRSYIEAEKQDKSNPARIQCLYERSVAECPLDSSLWIEYLNYISNSLKIPDVVLDVAERASRNCPWVIEVWTEYLIAAEKFDSDKLVGIFEKAILNCHTIEQVGTMWLKYLESLRRVLRAKEYPEKETQIFLANTNAAEQHVLSMCTDPEPNEFVFQIVMMNSRLLASTSNDLKDVRETWKDLLNRGYGYSFRNWLQYLLLEQKYGDTSSYRQQLSKSSTYVKDDIHSVASLWLNFERDNGDIAQMQACEKKLSKYFQELSVQELTSSNSAAGYGSQYDSYRKDFASGKNKRKFKKDKKDEVPKKKRKGSGEDMTDGNVFKVPVVPPTAKKRPGTNNAPEKPQAATTVERVLHDPSKDNRTVFLSNLAFTTDEEKIRSFFETIGVISELRLVKDFKGRSKGYAYVIFESPDAVPEALKKDREGLDGRPVFVSKCDPDKSTRTAGFKFATKLEKNKLFIRDIPVTMTKEDLTKLYAPFGALKDVRLVTFRNGRSREKAFVEFEDEIHAAKALKETDGIEIEGKKISVALSNPPPKKDGKDVPSDMKMLQRKAPTAFVPRSLQVQKKGKDETPAQDKGGTPKPMTNEEFRNKFLGTTK